MMASSKSVKGRCVGDCYSCIFCCRSLLMNCRFPSWKQVPRMTQM